MDAVCIFQQNFVEDKFYPFDEFEEFLMKYKEINSVVWVIRSSEKPLRNDEQMKYEFARCKCAKKSLLKTIRVVEGRHVMQLGSITPTNQPAMNINANVSPIYTATAINAILETGAELSPPHLFEHVTRGLEPLLHPGQVLEARSNPDDDAEHWWPAEVVTTSCHLILFRWCVLTEVARTDTSRDELGADKKSTTSHSSRTDPTSFWFDVKGSNWYLIRPLKLDPDKLPAWIPPRHLKNHVQIFADSSEACRLWKSKTKNHLVPNIFFECRASFIYETIRVGGYFECEHENNPLLVWPAKVLRNIGGRLELTWFGANSKQQNNSEASTFTLYYTHRRVHPVGWGKIRSYSYSPPPGLVPTRSITNTDAFIRGAPCALAHLYGDDCGNSLLALRKVRRGHALYQPDPPLHEFKVGWKLEAVNPRRPCVIQPATIAKVFNAHYFLVQLDDLTQPNCDYNNHSFTEPEQTNQRIVFVTHAGAAEIMSVNTSQLRGLHLAPPSGWSVKRPFTWTNYLTFLSENDHVNISHDEDLLPLALTNNFHKSQISSFPWGSPIKERDVIEHPPNDLMCNHASHSCNNNNSTHLYCPSENEFKGIAAPDRFPSPVDADPSTRTQLGSDHSSNPLDNQTKSLSCFLLGMKLEMVVPSHLLHLISTNDQIHPLCTATVTRVEQNLLWLLLDLHLPSGHHTPEPVMVDARSTDLYPVGWASLVGHSIIGPPGYSEPTEAVIDNQPMKLDEPPSPVDLWNVGLKPTHDLQYQTITYESEEICPPIYVNTRCYLGPFLCRVNLDQLPKCFGPGPTPRVLHNLLTRLVSAAYKPIRVLRMLEVDWASNLVSTNNNLRTAERTSNNGVVGRGRFNLSTARIAMIDAESEAIEQCRSGMQLVVLRIRCPRRGVKVEAPVEVCRRARAVEEFCRQVSLLLEACPHLISTQPPYSHSTTDPVSFVNSNLPHGSARSMKSSQLSVAAIRNLIPSHSTPECPSFCLSRLRARNSDRQPGWKRRMYASLRPFGVQPPSLNSTKKIYTRDRLANANLRTRSAVAAQQQQQHYLTKSVSPNHGLTNGLPINRNSRRLRGRGRIKYRGSSHCRLSSQDADLQSNSPIIPHCTETKLAQDIAQESEFSYKSNVYTHTCVHNQDDWQNNHPENSQHMTNHIRSSHRVQSGEKYLQDALFSSTPRIVLNSNPLFWSPVDLAAYLDETDCREMWPWLAAEAVDGQAFMLLTLPVLHHLVGLRWEDALRLARHAVAVKRAFLEQFGADASEPKTINCVNTK